MSMSDLEQGFQLIDQNSESADFSGPKSEELIRSAEAALGLTLPPTYREFVKRLGCGDIAGQEFYGIIDDNFEDSGVPNGIWLTLDARKNFNLPEALILVGANGFGGDYVIDTSTKNADGDSPVVEWWPNNLSQVMAADFGAFLLQQLRQALG
jgi:antitoxin YobK